MTTKMQKTLVVLAVGATFAASGAVMAATLTWDSSGSSPTAPVDGTGTWNTTDTNWTNGTTDAAWNNTSDSSYTAVFGANNGTAGTVTLGSNITAGGLTFNPATSSNYTIAGSGSYGLTLTGSSVVVNTNATLAANTTFQQGLNLTGRAGVQLTISGTNTNTVGTTVGGGGSALGSGTVLSIANLNSLTNANFGAPLGTGQVMVENNSLLNISGGDSTGTLANPISISGIGQGGAALTLGGINMTYNLTGPMTIINGGPSNDAQIMVNGSSGMTANLNGVIGGSGNFTINGQAGGTADNITINFNTAATYTGNTNLYSYAASTLMTLQGGANTLPSGTTLDLASGVWNNQASPLVLDLHGNNQNVAMLNVTAVAAQGSTITVEDTTGSGATLTMTGTGPGTSKPGTVAAYANFVNGAAINFLTNFTDSSANDGVAIFNGTTVNLASGVTFSAPLNLYLAANNSNGTVNLNGGTLASNGITTAGTGVATVNLDGTLAMTANSPVVGTTWIMPNIILNVLSEGVTLNVASGVQGVVYSPFLQGPSSSTGGVTVTGGGTVVMDGTNTYTGPTVVNAGTLALGTYTYTPSGATSSTTQIGSIADSSMLTINSGGTFDISAITATPTTLKGLTISGGTINVAMDGSGNVSNIVLNSAAIVSGTNTINFAAASGVTVLTPGTYTLLADTNGGLTGTFLFGNGTNSEKYTLGSDSYMLTLENTNTAETLNVGAGAPVPEPATLGLMAIGGLGLVLIGRKRKAQV
ncbi:MAG: PEP-CTERM sorting domain-containing protein [Planctomycetia bacterium]|nr:PEP-CTERM sorting domain-containing protein [Planctomycetia bacterium]